MENQMQHFEEQPQMPPAPTPPAKESNRILIKAGIIAFLTLLMLVPSSLISELVKERAERQQEVIKEVSSKWAEPQTINGPVIKLPYFEQGKNADGKDHLYKNYAYLLPNQLSINGSLNPETRHRGIFDVTLYSTALNLKGSFNKIDLAALHINPASVQWSDAELLMGINDTRGLEEAVSLNWNGSKQIMETNITDNDIISSGLSSSIDYTESGTFNFDINIKCKGSENLSFIPIAQNTIVTLNSPWRDPQFFGKFIPNNDPKQDQSGFRAIWKIPHTARPLLQSWKNTKQHFDAYAFGVKLIQPIDAYAKTDRSVKYALLFIGLSFTVFFFIEILQKQQIHPLQYFLVGIALTIFYTLLLSLSEYTGFNIAYFIAATATIALIGLYVWNIFKKGKIALGFTLALAALYSYIFFLIQLQDYALVFGSIGLFIVLAIVMYSSRNVDWYQVGKKEKPILT